jgi:hypothetical protein
MVTQALTYTFAAGLSLGGVPKPVGAGEHAPTRSWGARASQWSANTEVSSAIKSRNYHMTSVAQQVDASSPTDRDLTRLWVCGQEFSVMGILTAPERSSDAWYDFSGIMPRHTPFIRCDSQGSEAATRSGSVYLAPFRKGASYVNSVNVKTSIDYSCQAAEGKRGGAKKGDVKGLYNPPLLLEISKNSGTRRVYSCR